MSLNQETELLAPHAESGLVQPQDANAKTNGRDQRPKKRKVAAAEHMKYHKTTTKRRALKVRCDVCIIESHERHAPLSDFSITELYMCVYKSKVHPDTIDKPVCANGGSVSSRSLSRELGYILYSSTVPEQR